MFLIITTYLISGGSGRLTMLPFIRYPADKENSMFINHDKTHLRQQLELLVLFFFLLILSALCKIEEENLLREWLSIVLFCCI
jgi:hypothetical protein